MYFWVQVVWLFKKQIWKVLEIVIISHIKQLNKVILWTVYLDPAFDASYVFDKFPVFQKHLFLFFNFFFLLTGKFRLILLCLFSLFLDFSDIQLSLGGLLLQYFQVLMAKFIKLFVNKLCERELDIVEILIQEVHILNFVHGRVYCFISWLEEFLGIVK